MVDHDAIVLQLEYLLQSIEPARVEIGGVRRIQNEYQK